MGRTALSDRIRLAEEELAQHRRGLQHYRRRCVEELSGVPAPARLSAGFALGICVGLAPRRLRKRAAAMLLRTCRVMVR